RFDKVRDKTGNRSFRRRCRNRFPCNAHRPPTDARRDKMIAPAFDDIPKRSTGARLRPKAVPRRRPSRPEARSRQAIIEQAQPTVRKPLSVLVVFSSDRTLESDYDIGPAVYAHRIDESHITPFRRHHERMCADPVAEEAHAFEYRAVGDARAGEDDFL